MVVFIFSAEMKELEPEMLRKKRQVSPSSTETRNNGGSDRSPGGGGDHDNTGVDPPTSNKTVPEPIPNTKPFERGNVTTGGGNDVTAEDALPGGGENTDNIHIDGLLPSPNKHPPPGTTGTSLIEAVHTLGPVPPENVSPSRASRSSKAIIN